MLKKMPVPIITGVPPSTTKSITPEKQPNRVLPVTYQNGTGDKTLEADEVAKLTESVEKGQDCLDQVEGNANQNSIDIGSDFEDLTSKAEGQAVVELAAVPTVKTEASARESSGFLDDKAVLPDEHNGDKNTMIAALRAVETVPCTSYSSSDDDDEDDDAEFFDANEFNEISGEEGKASNIVNESKEIQSIDQAKRYVEDPRLRSHDAGTF